MAISGRPGVTESDFSFTTHDGQTLAGKLTLPADTTKRAPVVVFLGGSGAWDADYAQRLQEGQLNYVLPVSRLAREAASAGLAFVRFQKRGVVNPGARLTEQWKTMHLDNLLMDARTLLDKIKDDPRLDGRRVAFVGHSEGTMIATWVGESDPSVKAFVFLGLVRRNLKDVFRSQLVDRNAGLLFPFADTKPRDGYLGPTEIEVATKKGLRFGKWRTFDENRDGRLSKGEYVRLLDDAYRSWVQAIEASQPTALVPGNGSPAAWFHQHFRRKTVGETWQHLRTPVLVVQGKSDLNTPFATEAEPFLAMLKAQHHPDHQLIGLEGLDHWFKDKAGRSKAEQAFVPIIPWLKKRLLPE
jgi:pimeloyl-ACP methyl ester carboxylesterase